VTLRLPRPQSSQAESRSGQVSRAPNPQSAQTDGRSGQVSPRADARSGPADGDLMARALFHAARGQGRTTPNPMVGAVIVAADGVVVGHGWHERAGEAHAEVNAIVEAGSRARGGTLYVTLEPCCHTGRTGPCTRRIIDAGIARVVAAMTDPDPRVSGRGFQQLREAGVAVETGLGEAAARRLNQAFISVKTRGRPLVMLKAAASLDARIATPGERTKLSSPEADRKTQHLRAAVDAIAVGSETLLIDDPLLTARDCRRVRPLPRVLFDRRLRTPASARVFSTLDHGPVIILTSVAALQARERLAALERAGALVRGVDDLDQALRALLEWDISTVLVEGGATLHGALWDARLVDRVHLIVTPRTIGPDGVRLFGGRAVDRSALTQVTVEPRGTDIWIEADVHRNR
jgi:diaminohydroxyphosphoribosylaminopyrimidine deaminase / 5-amino-6-(5-phosphoribosylamino)uracil reductase